MRAFHEQPNPEAWLPYNILERWRLTINFEVSEYAIHPNSYVEKSQVDFIYKTLKDYLPEEFFIITPGFEYNLISLDHENWIHALLSKNISFTNVTGTVYQLYELSLVVNYFEENKPELLQDLKKHALENNFEMFRSYYFELFTFYTLAKNNITLAPKKFEGNRELEGTCYLNGQEFLFECRKLFLPEKTLNDIKLIKWVDLHFGRLMTGTPSEIIVSVVLGNDQENQYIKDNFISIMNAYLSKTRKLNHVPNNVWSYPENSDSPLITIRPYTPENRVIAEYDLREKIYNLLFTIPPSFIKPSGLNQVRITSQGVTNILTKKMGDVLIKRIEEKRKARRDSKFSHRLYLFENENYPGIHRALVSYEQFTDVLRAKVQTYINSKKTNDIIGLIFKDSDVGEIPKVHVEFFCREELNSYKSIMSQMVWDAYRIPVT